NRTAPPQPHPHPHVNVHAPPPTERSITRCKTRPQTLIRSCRQLGHTPPTFSTHPWPDHLSGILPLRIEFGRDKSIKPSYRAPIQPIREHVIRLKLVLDKSESHLDRMSFEHDWPRGLIE